MAQGLVRKTRSNSTARRIGARSPKPAKSPLDLLTGASDGQSLAALGTPCIDHRPAATGFHANEKPVRASTPDFGSLIGAFHDARRRRLDGAPSAGMRLARTSHGTRGLERWCALRETRD